MANIWVDKLNINNENSGQPTTNKANLLQSARQHSVKKQAFGNLKNAMNSNLTQNTPLRGGLAVKSDAFHGLQSATKSYSALPKQTFKQNCTKLEQQRNVASAVKKSSKAANSVDVQLFDNFDFSSVCCVTDCHKTDEQIWSEQLMLDDARMDMIFKGTPLYDDEADDLSDLLKSVKNDDDDDCFIDFELPDMLSDTHVDEMNDPPALPTGFDLSF